MDIPEILQNRINKKTTYQTKDGKEFENIFMAIKYEEMKSAAEADNSTIDELTRLASYYGKDFIKLIKDLVFLMEQHSNLFTKEYQDRFR